MHRNYPRQKFLWKPNFLQNQTCSGTNQGVFQKEETQGYPNMNFENSVTNVEMCE